MQSANLIIHARWIIPIVPKNKVFEHCSLVIQDRCIVDICPSESVADKYATQQTVYLDQHVLIPGLINTHGHTPMSLFRGYADDKPLMEWLEEHIWPAEGRWVDETFVRDGSELAIAEMLRSGTTCFSDMYFFPEVTAKVAQTAGIRAQITFPILDFPSAWASDADEYIHKGLALHDLYRAHDLIKVSFGPHAPYTVSDPALAKVATLSEELQTGIQIHLHETAYEVSQSVEQYDMRPIERLSQLGLLTPLTQCVHMTQLCDSDMDLLAQSGAHVIHCPESNLKLASGLCPSQQLLERGINVSLGTDGAASNNNLDLLGEMRTAALIGKYMAQNATAIDAHTALNMATLNGAKAIGIDGQVGSLEVGKEADITAIAMDELESQPNYDIISQVVYAASAHQVSHVWVAGQCLLDNRQLTTLSEPSIVERAQHWQSRISDSSR